MNALPLETIDFRFAPCLHAFFIFGVFPRLFDAGIDDMEANLKSNIGSRML